MNIAETLLHDPKQRHFNSFREPPQIRRRLQLDLHPTALGEAVREPAHRRSQAALIQQRRMQQVGQRADIARRSVQQRQAFSKRLARLDVEGLR